MKTLVSIFMAILMATLMAILKAMVLMTMTHIRRLVTLNPVLQYPRKDILAPSSSTVNTKAKVAPDGVNNGDDENDADENTTLRMGLITSMSTRILYNLYSPTP